MSFRDDWELEIQKRDELYSKSAYCDHCGLVIDEKIDACALYITRKMKWVLLHVRRCSVDLTSEEVERLRGTSECVECDKPATTGRFCTRHYVENKL